MTAQTVPGPLIAEQDAGRGGCREDAHALDPPRDDVRRGQLLRAAGERRHERRLRRPRERDRRGCGRGECVDEHRRRIRKESQRSGAHRQRLRAVRLREHPGGAAAVRERRRERGEDSRGNELCDRDETRGRRSALLVREDEHRDPGRKLGGVERDERQLDAPQLGIPEDRRQDAENGHQRLLSRYSTAALITRSTAGNSRTRAWRPPSG